MPPHTKLYRNVNREVAANLRGVEYNKAAGGSHYDPGTVLTDGPELRRRILAGGARWGNWKTYAGYARMSVVSGIINVLNAMVADGLMETEVFKCSLGKWKWTKRELRPDMRVWRRTAAGAAALARLTP